jgi:hypothetical protein
MKQNGDPRLRGPPRQPSIVIFADDRKAEMQGRRKAAAATIPMKDPRPPNKE